MSERETRTVTVFCAGQWDEGKVPERLIDVKKWVDELLEQIPPEYQSEARFEFGDDGDWEAPRGQLSVWYERPETDEEMAGRLDCDRQYEENEKMRERREYERLKAKYA